MQRWAWSAWKFMLVVCLLVLAFLSAWLFLAPVLSPWLRRKPRALPAD